MDTYVTFSRNYDYRFYPSPFKPSFTMCQCFLILAFPQFDLLLDYDSEDYIINLTVSYLIGRALSAVQLSRTTRTAARLRVVSTCHAELGVFLARLEQCRPRCRT